jgi:hypothetical protein
MTNSILNLSTLNGTNGFKINGIAANDISGTSVSNAGDINGDGIDDLIIGAKFADPNGSLSGQSYVVFGSRNGFIANFNLATLNGSNGFKINGIAKDDISGTSVSSAGDINGDGIDDLIIGAYHADPNGSLSGQSYVVFGSRSGFSASLNLSALNGGNGFKINGIAAYDESGNSVSSAGDINGDGIDDLIIGAPSADPNGNFSSGQSYVVFGSRGGFISNFNLANLSGNNGFKINGIAAGDRSGLSVSSAGDINGDGIDDLIIGSLASPNGSNSGQSYVVFGSRLNTIPSLNLSTRNLSNIDGTNGFKINGIALGDRSGVSVSSAGDINGDGIDDLIIGAFDADPNGSNSGQSYVVFGSRSGFTSNLNLSDLNGTNGFKINGIAQDDQSGQVSSAGDINGDGIDDLIIGSVNADPNGSSSGQSYVVFGSRSTFSANLNLSTLNGTNGFKVNGIAANDRSGTSVSSAGDINGDGIDDLIIGATGADPNGTGSGQSYVVYGNAAPELDLNGTNNLVPGFKINGIYPFNYSGNSVSSAGDINGDGIDDLIIGAKGADPSATTNNAGQSYVVFGSRSGFSSDLSLSNLNGSNGFKINGVAAGDYSGTSVSSAGDINGDGIDDLIIGAPVASINAINSGQSYVVFGSRSGFSASLDLYYLNTTNGFRINGMNATDLIGSAVSSAGDINGDGIDDLIIGAPLASSLSGQSYVVFGSRSGFGAGINLSALNGNNGFTIYGNPSDRSGNSVSSAGDINGDGIDDLIVGAPGGIFGPNGDNGQSYVVFGSRSGFSAGLSLSTLNGGNGFRINGIATGDKSGTSVSSAGDINGDGIDDLIIGAKGADPNGTDSGQSYVVFGSRSGFSASLNLSTLNGSNGFKINGILALDNSGYSVSSAGDINGDGIDDLIIGTPYADPNGTDSGQSYIVFGSRSGFSASLNLSTLNGSNGFKINGVAAADRSGYSVSSAGDINGDGIDDLMIGAPGNASSGRSYVVFGRAGIGSSGTVELSQLSGSNTDGINFSTTFTGTAVAVVDTDLTLVDRNSRNLAGATITITNPVNGAAETLSATTTGSISSSYSTATGVLTLSGTGTVAQYQQVLRTVTYNNTAATPHNPLSPANLRTITFVVNDGAAGSNTSILATTTLSLAIPVNTVTIAAQDANAAETASDPGVFRITRTGVITGALTVNYTIGGTATGTGQGGADYTTLSTFMNFGFATIDAGASFVDVTITPVDDLLVEGSETVSLTLTSDSNYTLGGTTNAVVSIADNDFNGTAGDDLLFGDGGNNAIYGLAGNDGIYDYVAGNDALYGGAGNDTLYGGLGTDTLYGGTGDDSYYLSYTASDLTNDAAVENPKEGTDTAYAIFTVTALADNVENLSLLGTGNIDGTGNSLDNIILGNSGINTLDGGAGNDFVADFYNTGSHTLIGGEGNDILYGGGANDTLIGGNGDDTYYLSLISTELVSDTITETATGGIDNAISVASVTQLSDNIEKLYLVGTADINGTGNSGDNTILGNSGNNSLFGGAGNDFVGDFIGGNDTFNGGAGNDILFGGTGNDSFVFSGNSLLSFQTAIGVDNIADFTVNDDIILLSKGNFGSLTTAAGNLLLSADFATVTTDTATTLGSSIVYNSANGKLFYDANGAAAGFGTGGQFAQLSSGLGLTGNQFKAIV